MNSTFVIVVFLTSLVGILYSYLLYPLLLMILPRRNRLETSADYLPKVSMILAAYNEENRIEKKLLNSLEIDYPCDHIEIIVASDASDDQTNQIVGQCANRDVQLIVIPERKGKENAQTSAIKSASGDILVFSDIGATLTRDSIRKIVRNFADPRVGAVSSEDRFVAQDGRVAGEGVYLKYEMWLRRLESDMSTLIGLTGAFFAVRSELCDDWDTAIPSDYNAALTCIRHGRIAVSDPEVICTYSDIQDNQREYQRKVRTIIRGWSATFRHPQLLNPFMFGIASLQIWSHKIARWLVPWFLVFFFLSTIAMDHPVAKAIVVIQVVFYVAAILGAVSKRLRRIPLIQLLYFFALVNLAAAHGTLAFLMGRRVAVWQPSKR